MDELTLMTAWAHEAAKMLRSAGCKAHGRSLARATLAMIDANPGIDPDNRAKDLRRCAEVTR